MNQPNARVKKEEDMGSEPLLLDAFGLNDQAILLWPVPLIRSVDFHPSRSVRGTQAAFWDRGEAEWGRRIDQGRGLGLNK